MPNHTSIDAVCPNEFKMIILWNKSKIIEGLMVSRKISRLLRWTVLKRNRQLRLVEHHVSSTGLKRESL